jgi:sugar phosphate isomerase/epimerase
MSPAPLSLAAPELFGTGPVSDDLSVLDSVVELGIEAIELWTPWQIGLGDAESVARRLSDGGLGIACISSPSYLHGDPTGDGRRLIALAIEVAGRLGVPRINTYFGHGGDGVDAHAIAAYLDLVAELVGQASAAGVTIVVENEFDAFGHDPEHWDVSRRPASLRDLVDRIDDPALRLNLDAANFLCAGADVEAAADLLADAVGYVHVKDVVPAGTSANAPPGWNDFTDGDEHFHTIGLGDGAVPWPHVLASLTAAGYGGPYTLEPHCVRERVVDEVARSVAYLRAVGI